MEKFLYPTQSVRCIITGPTECAKSVSLTNLILSITNKFEKNIHLLTKCRSRYISKFM